MIRLPNSIITWLRVKCHCKQNNNLEQQEDGQNLKLNEEVTCLTKNNINAENNRTENEITVSTTNKSPEPLNEKIDRISESKHQNIIKVIENKVEKKKQVPPGEGWNNIADALNWFTGAVFVALNVLLFAKYIMPLLICRIANSSVTDYLIDAVKN